MTSFSLKSCVCTALLTLMVLPAQSALLFFAELTLNGTDLDGDTTMNQIGGVDVASNHLECFALTWDNFIPGASDPRASGRVTYGPIVIRKRLDKASPLLLQGFARNERIEGDFKVFDTATVGVTRHRFTYQITDGRIISVRHIIPDVLDPATATKPPMEEIMIAFGSLTLIDEVNSTQFTISTTTQE